MRSTSTADRRTAEEKLEAFKQRIFRHHDDEKISAATSVLRRIYRRTLSRASRLDISVELTAEDLFGMYDRQLGRCAMTDIELDLTNGRTKGHKRPWAPSLDRIDNKNGYTKANCRLVCVAANFAMNEWGESVLREMAVGYMGRMRRKAKSAAKSKR